MADSSSFTLKEDFLILNRADSLGSPSKNFTTVLIMVMAELNQMSGKKYSLQQVVTRYRHLDMKRDWEGHVAADDLVYGAGLDEEPPVDGATKSESDDADQASGASVPTFPYGVSARLMCPQAATSSTFSSLVQLGEYIPSVPGERVFRAWVPLKRNKKIIDSPVGAGLARPLCCGLDPKKMCNMTRLCVVKMIESQLEATERMFPSIPESKLATRCGGSPAELLVMAEKQRHAVLSLQLNGVEVREYHPMGKYDRIEADYEKSED